MFFAHCGCGKFHPMNVPTAIQKIASNILFSHYYLLVRVEGLEAPSLAAAGPKPAAVASFATPALVIAHHIAFLGRGGPRLLLYRVWLRCFLTSLFTGEFFTFWWTWWDSNPQGF